MKQFVFGFCAVLVFTVGSVRAASAQDWWWHTGPGAMGAGAGAGAAIGAEGAGATATLHFS